MPVRTDPGPRGAALYAALRRMIEDGRVPPGAKLPPSRVLAAQARIARNVVVAAFERLAAEGYVVARVGAGSFVAPDVPRLAPRAPRPLPAPTLLPAMPGRLGSAMADPRSFDLLRRLLAREAGAWIIEDDYDSEFRYAGPPLAALQGIDDAGRVVYVGTFSKSLFPGLRVGYAVLPEAILGKAIALRERTDRQPSTIADGALAAFIAEGHLAAHVRRARKRARAARDALVAGLAQGPLLAQAPDQGLHLVASLPGWLDEARAIEVAAQAGLFARPLSAMHLARRRRTGLVMGFSGFSPEAFAIAAREASARLAQLSPRRVARARA